VSLIYATVTAGLLMLPIGFGLVFAKLLSRDRTTSLPDDLEALFSPGRYRAMQRLLAEADPKFISSQPGCTPQLEKKLRKARIKIFRGYVRMMSGDFKQICKTIKFLMVSCRVDRSELAGIMMKQQFLFSVGMMHVEYKLLLYGFGWSRVDVGGLVHALDAMRAQLQSLVAVTQPASA
jgi:hypothetical protein